MRPLLLFMFTCVLSFGAIDINKANMHELLKIKGVGETKAEAILSYRKKGGCFNKLEDLQKVKGFGEKFIEKNRGKNTIIANGCKKQKSTRERK